MGFVDLFAIATMPVLKVLIVTALGSFLALDSINILGPSTRKQVNNIVYFVFNPALVGSNLASTITYESIISLWFMPVNILITFIIGSALGWVFMMMVKPPQHLKGLVLGTCAAGNLGNMLLIILPAVCKEKGSPFGDPNVCYEYGMAYASVSLATVGFIIGTVAPMRMLLIGTEAPLRVIQDSASLVGDAANPTVTLIVGGNLLRGLKGSSISLPLVFGIIVVRYVFLPFFGIIIIVKGAVYMGLVHADPLYVFVLLLQFAVPPAMNTGTIMQLFGVGESECSVIMLWTYGLASMSLTLWSTFFMWLVA